MRYLAFVLALGMGVPGCSSVVATAGMDVGEAKGRKAAFDERFRATNWGRQSAGLPLLDYCSEKYWFDHDWARSDKPCARRIRRFENGDSSALNPPGMVLASTVVAVPDSIQRIYDERAKEKAREASKYW